MRRCLQCQPASVGTESTHWRAGTCGSTWSVRWAATSHILRALQEGQTPLALHENGMIRSWPQSSHLARANPVGEDAAPEVAPEQDRSGPLLGPGENVVGCTQQGHTTQAHDDEAERERRLSRPVLDALHQAGLSRMFTFGHWAV